MSTEGMGYLRFDCNCNFIIIIIITADSIVIMACFNLIPVVCDGVTLASRNTSSDRHTDGHEHFLGAADLSAPPSPHGNA